MNILIDSSVWIDYFCGGKTKDKVDLLLDNNIACTSGLILAELIPFINQKKQKVLASLLQELPYAEININWNQIITYQELCLKKGVNEIGLPDLILLQTTIQNKLSFFTLDKHFQLMHKFIDFNLFL